MSTKTINILGEMRKALAMAHKTNNGRAISKDFALGTGVSEEAYTSWTTWVETLHTKVTPWVERYDDPKITDDELKEIYKAVFPILRQLKKVDDKLFIRENDAIRICGFAAKHGKSANGSVDVLVGAKGFRREIETMFGIRMAQNSVLTEDEYDIICKYEAAENNKKKAEQKLEGYERGGKEVKGLRDQLVEATKIYNDMKTLAGITKEVETKLKKEKKNLFEAYPIISGYAQTVLDLESDVKNTEERLKKAEETIKKHDKKYKEIMGKISEIE